MTPERYHELIGRLFDDDWADAEAEELARGLKEQPQRCADLRRQLALWDLWSQEVAPERSAAAFVASWKTRCAAEADAAEFQAAVQSRLAEESDLKSSLGAALGAWWKAFRRPLGFGWTAGAILTALAMVFWLAAPHSGSAAVTIHGDAVCTACVLHESHDHRPAIRVGVGKATTIYYLECNQAMAGLQGYFCSGPTPAVATGRDKLKEGRHNFEADSVKIPASEKNPLKTKPDERIIFPL